MSKATNTPPTAEVSHAVTPIAYTRLDAASALGISPRKLDQVTADRNSGIPVVRIGTKVLFPVEALTRWLVERIGKQVS